MSHVSYKTIFIGRLDFGGEKTFDKVLRMSLTRIETFYKKDINLKEAEIFDPASSSLVLPRVIGQANEKTWNNTINLLEYAAQFALSGQIYAWWIDNGNVLQHFYIEPRTDKAAVQNYLEGRKLLKEPGGEREAIALLNQAIEKHEGHAMAFERRGHAHYMLHQFKESHQDYTQSIALDDKNPEPYVGRATVRLVLNDLNGALQDLTGAIQNSLPIQPIYWRARRMKGEVHLKLNSPKEAITEFRLFIKRNFPPGDPNYSSLHRTQLNYGRALLDSGQFTEAIDAFNVAMENDPGKKEHSQNAEPLVLRGIAMKRAGQSGFVSDWKAAADLGSEKAAALLAEIS